MYQNFLVNIMRIMGILPHETLPSRTSPRGGLSTLFCRSWVPSLTIQKAGCVLLLIALIGLLVTAGCTGSAGHWASSGSPSLAATTPTVTELVVTAGAYPPAEPYEIDPRFVENSPQYRVESALFTEVYHDRFTMNYTSAGLLATVEKAPLVIDFSVIPGNRDPVYSFFILTVRDADSSTVVGQEGYGRTFSTESPKRLIFMSPGRYHLNLYGNLVEVDLKIRMKE